MVPFHLQLELSGRPAAIMAEQLEQLSDSNGFMRYQVRTFNHNTVVHVSVDEGSAATEDLIGFNEEEVFTHDETISIALAIREYNKGRQLNFDQMNFDF